MWSGLFNFIGVLTSSGLVAFGIISLLPVELILQVSSQAGFAMVFALLIAAIIWNFGTWYMGIPNSSSHSLVGSIIGVGLMNQLLSTQSGTSGVDWNQALGVIKSLLFSRWWASSLAGGLLLLAKTFIRIPALYKAPEGNQPPPWWIRGLLILTCTGVSFAHGSNDGQKGMGLIMLILIGTVPTTYALNKALPDSQIPVFEANSTAAATVVTAKAAGHEITGNPRPAVTLYVAQHQINDETFPALGSLITSIDAQLTQYGSLSKIPNDVVGNTRNDMYLTSEAVRLLVKDKAAELSADDISKFNAYRKSLDDATKFIPAWVKVAVALALGLGTMIGWKRIVVTVGEKIGKDHLTYAQGASAEVVAMITIGAADMYGLPVSTTHILTSGVAGTMAANGSGLQWGHREEPGAGLGADAPGGDHALRLPVLAVPQRLLSGRQKTSAAAPGFGAAVFLEVREPGRGAAPGFSNPRGCAIVDGRSGQSRPVGDWADDRFSTVCGLPSGVSRPRAPLGLGGRPARPRRSV